MGETQMTHITIDGKEIEVDSSLTILEAAQKILQSKSMVLKSVHQQALPFWKLPDWHILTSLHFAI